MAEAPSVSTSTDWMAAKGIWFTSTKDRPPRALAPESGRRRPSRRTRVERLRSEICEPPEVALPPAILPLVAPRLPLPAKLGMRVCMTSRRFEPRPERSISAWLIMVTGAASASAAVGMLEPVMTNAASFTVSLAGAGAAVAGDVWASVGAAVAIQPARTARRVREDFMAFGFGLGVGSETGWAPPVRGVVSPGRFRLMMKAPVEASRTAAKAELASIRSRASCGANSPRTALVVSPLTLSVTNTSERPEAAANCRKVVAASPRGRSKSRLASVVAAPSGAAAMSTLHEATTAGAKGNDGLRRSRATAPITPASRNLFSRIRKKGGDGGNARGDTVG